MLVDNDLKTMSGNPWSVTSIYQAIVFSNDSCEVSTKHGFDAALNYEARRTALHGTFSGLLQKWDWLLQSDAKFISFILILDIACLVL